MRQFRTYGSVRGAAGNRWPYRDPLFSSTIARSAAKPRLISELPIRQLTVLGNQLGVYFLSELPIRQLTWKCCASW